MEVVTQQQLCKPVSPDVDRFEVVLPDLVNLKCLKGKKVVLGLHASKRLWVQKFNWVTGPFPTDIVIKYLPKNPIKTPIVRRLNYHHKEIKYQTKGRNAEKRLSEFVVIPIYAGEITNEQVIYPVSMILIFFVRRRETES